MDGDIPLRSLVNQSKKQKQIRKLKIVGPNPINSSTSTSTAVFLSSSLAFKLVIQRRRRVNRRFDKYYYEPGTGQKFRSLLSVQKYLNGENVEGNRSKPNHEKNGHWPSTSKQNKLDFAAADANCSASSTVSQISICQMVGLLKRSDVATPIIQASLTCYIESGTGKRFRSLTSVERYLAEGKKYASPKASNQVNQLYLTDGKEHAAFSLGDHTPSKCSRNEIYDLQQPLRWSRKHVPTKEVETSIIDLCNPPAKTKWVLGLWGNIWCPFIDDIQVPDSVKHKWSDTFKWILNDR